MEKKNVTLDPRHGTLALDMEPSTLDPRQKDRLASLTLEREQIRQISLDLGQLTSDTSLTLEKLFLERAKRDFRVARRPC